MEEKKNRNTEEEKNTAEEKTPELSPPGRKKTFRIWTISLSLRESISASKSLLTKRKFTDIMDLLSRQLPIGCMGSDTVSGDVLKWS